MLNNDTFDRSVQNSWEVEQYGLPLVQYAPKRELEVPLSYVLDIEVEQGKTQRITYYYITEDEEIPHLIEWVKELRVVGYDLETSGLFPMDDKIATMQFGNPKAPDPRAYVLDVRALSLEALEPVLALLQDKTLVKLGQNLGFECRWTQFHYGASLRGCWDTQIAEQVSRAGLFSAKAANSSTGSADRAAYKYTSMAMLTQRYLGIDIDKDHDLRTSFYKTPIAEHSLRQIVYAAGDVVYPFYIASKQKELIAQRKLENIVKIEMGIIPVLADMSNTGFRVDVAKWRILWQDAVKRRAEIEQQLDALMLGMQPDLFGGTNTNVRPIYTGSKKPQPLNYSSSPQVKWAVKQYCQSISWPVKILTTEKQVLDTKIQYGQDWLATHKGKVAADIPEWLIPEAEYCVLAKADKNTLILAKCRKQLPANLVDLLVEYSKYDIRASTFGNEFLRKHVRADTGCIHTDWNQVITATGRLSSNPNLQNIPSGRDYRACFIPKLGYLFVTFDYSSVEPRISAQVSKDPHYVSTFLGEDDDLYVAVAEVMLGYRPNLESEDEIEHAKAKLERKIFKTVVLALAYLMGPRTLRDRLTLALADEIMAGTIPLPTFEYASYLWNKFFETHDILRQHQNARVQEARPRHAVGDKWSGEETVPNPRRIWDDFLQEEVTWVTAPCGRKRFFADRGYYIDAEAANVEPQAGSATITKAAMLLIQNEIDSGKWDAHIVNAVHDEIVVMVRKDQAAAFAPIMKALMEKSGNHYCPDIPIKVAPPDHSTGVTRCWAKEITPHEAEEVAALLAAA